MVPPALLALTTTPSMAPSLADDTCPARAAGACALALWVAAKQNAARAAVRVDRRVRMGASPWRVSRKDFPYKSQPVWGRIVPVGATLVVAQFAFFTSSVRGTLCGATTRVAPTPLTRPTDHAQ